MKAQHLVLMRHANAMGIAESEAQDDDGRKLSEFGKKNALTSAKKLARLAFFPEVIISSPLVRAVQTAEIMASSFNNTEIRIFDKLQGAFEIESTLTSLLTEFKEFNSLLAVGHQPAMGIMAGHFTQFPPELSPAGFTYVKAANLSNFNYEEPPESVEIYNP